MGIANDCIRCCPRTHAGAMFRYEAHVSKTFKSTGINLQMVYMIKPLQAV